MSTPQLPSSAVAERRSAGFHRSVWGDYFLSYASCQKMELDDTVGKQLELEGLKDEVKRTFEDAAADDKPVDELLNLIDHIQRLGIGYQFEKEIDEALERIHKRSCEPVDGASCNNDFHTTALMFRLLRQQGYRIPCDVFSKFKGPEGNFDESLKTDARGLLSLYEASNLRVHGEEILDEALAFSLTHLNSMKEKLNPPLRDEISRALKHCIRKGFARLEAWHFIKIYEQDASHNEVLLKLAKLDFNMVQKLHQRELGDLTRWWKSLNVEKNFPFARDRLTEGYIWSLSSFEPHYAPVRMMFTKVLATFSIIDDIFDVHGTFEELELFAPAIERWDMEGVDELPEYMQLCYKALLNVYDEIEQMLPEEVRSYRISYGKRSAKLVVREYFEEAKWYHQQHTPTMDEYMRASLVSSGASLLVTTSFMGMGDVATEDAFQWILTDPKIVRASNIVYRLVNDILTHKFEQKRGHVASAVECYMRQHGVAEEEAKRELWKQVDDAWKDTNEELLRPTVVPAPLLTVILHITRMIDALYEEVDIYTHSDTKMKDIVTAILVEPLPM